jgi:hypothetical protein
VRSVGHDNEHHRDRHLRHHATMARVGAIMVVPVCRIHHRELHRSGDEAGWWKKLNVDPVSVALRFWRHTRTDGELGSTGEGAKQQGSPEGS